MKELISETNGMSNIDSLLQYTSMLNYALKNKITW